MIRKIILINIIFGVFASPPALPSPNNVGFLDDTSNDVNDERIVGGYAIDITSRPFQVALYTNGGFCGGSIIAPNKIVTAAHCVRGKSASVLQVYAGSIARNSGGYLFRVSRLAIHPSYNPNTFNFDVAVLTLSSSLTYSTKIRPIGLLSSTPADNTNGIVSGWGSTSEGGSVQTNLRAVQVPVVNPLVCRSQYGSYINSNMICAGFANGGRDSCQGDSGGPYTINNQLAGIVSFGYGCARAGYSGVYASVPALRTWILSQ